MPHDNQNANGDRGDHSDQTGQGSQDAIRHQSDALHHNFNHGSQPSETPEKNAQQSQARAQQDSVDMQQLEGQQPEIPKIGSCDAPGG